MKPKTFQDFYKACPAPRPVVPSSSGSIPTTTPTCEWPSPLAGYMTMTTPGKLFMLYILRSKYDLHLSVIVHAEVHDTGNTNASFEFTQKSKNILLYDTPKIKTSIGIEEDKVQKELIEIINDFKNNVHSISQVEKLVEEWKNRNDVQLSFKEKQDQLTAMRQKYEQIQTEMKSTMKKSTPFERIKKLFVKHKAEKHDVASAILSTVPAINVSFPTRPISSLSTSSSGSSGRMSTISGCSVGDSGTHSDNEERKVSHLYLLI